MKKSRLANVGNVLAAMFNFGEKTVKSPQVIPVKERVSEKGLGVSSMPKYYGFRKNPVMIETKTGSYKLETLKMADRKGLRIVDTMGITEKMKFANSKKVN